MTDEIAKQKISGTVGMLLILSLLPELSEYSHEALAAKVIGGMHNKNSKEKITQLVSEPNLSPSKQIRLDAHVLLEGFKFSSRGFSVSLGKERYTVPRSTLVETGLFIHLDIEPQSSKLDMNTYLKRASYYLAAMRVKALSGEANDIETPNYNESTKAHSIWLSKVSLSFVGETGVYHTAVYGGNLDVYSLDHKDLNDMNLEEIFIIDLNKAAAYYNSKKEILKGTRAEALSIFSEYMLTHLHKESISRIEDIYKVKVEVVEGGEVIMESIERRWITKRDAEKEAALAKKDAEIAEIEAKKDAEIAEIEAKNAKIEAKNAKILAIINKENPKLAAEIEAATAETEK